MRSASITPKGLTEGIKLGPLTILVGPNNTGKSETLRDIHRAYTGNKVDPLVVLEDVDIPVSELADFLSGVTVEESKITAGYQDYSGIDSSLHQAHVFQHQQSQLDYLYNAGGPDAIRPFLGRYHVSLLDAGSRLSVASSGKSYDPNTDKPSTLLQLLYLDKTVQAQLSDAFSATFGMQVRFDYTAMQTFSLRVAGSFPEVSLDPIEAYPIMSKIGRLDDQGDGFRSFVGVVLSVLLTQTRTILLDEPEAFLHPEQARRLGGWIARQSQQGDVQLVISTHNSHFLQGILGEHSDAQVIRLNREGNHTEFHLIAAGTTKQLATSPLLSSQRVIETLFHNHTVICESDTDRAIYQAVAQVELGDTDTLFISAQNKQTVAPIFGVLHSAGISVSAAVDFDMLNDDKELRKLMTAAGVTDPIQDELSAARTVVAQSIDSNDPLDVLWRMSELVDELLEQMVCGFHTLQSARGRLSSIRASASKWDLVKASGLDGLAAEALEAGSSLLTALSTFGINVVPVGELESWLKLGKKKGAKWNLAALDAIASGTCTQELKSYVALLTSPPKGMAPQ